MPYIMPHIKYSLKVEIDSSPVEELFASFEDDDIPDEEKEPGWLPVEERVKRVRERLAMGDVWAWALVTVIAECENFVGCSVVGGMTYKDEHEFKNKGEYQDMMLEAKEALYAAFERGTYLLKFFEQEDAYQKAERYSALNRA